LKSSGKEDKDSNVLANICILNTSDNQKIKDKSPSEYRKLMDDSLVPCVLNAAICPANMFSLEYDAFISERNRQLIEYAESLIV